MLTNPDEAYPPEEQRSADDALESGESTVRIAPGTRWLRHRDQYEHGGDGDRHTAHPELKPTRATIRTGPTPVVDSVAWYPQSYPSVDALD